MSATSFFSIARFNSSIADSIGCLSEADSLSPLSLSIRSAAYAAWSAWLRVSISFFRVRLGLPHHFVDFVLGQAARRRDGDLLLLLRRHVFCRDVDDAVRVDVK